MFKDRNEVQRLEDKLSKLSLQLYEKHSGGRRFFPRHPYVLVRVLPKEHQVGGIWLAETAQNKVIYEGIVLETWKPYDSEHRVTCDCGCGHKATKVVHHAPAVKIGQRVAFPHHEGLPLGEWLDDRYYRAVREGADQNQWPHCMVLGTIDYEGDAAVSAKIRELTKSIASITTSGLPESRGAQQ